MKLTENTNIASEVSNYSNHLNLVVGVLIFTISLGCLSFENPQKVAFFALPIVLGLIIGIEKFFPENIRIVRNLIKETEDKSTKQELRKELREHMNFAFFFDNLVFLWGDISFFIILLFPQYTDWLKAQ